jgi:hypothetical protein
MPQRELPRANRRLGRAGSDRPLDVFRLGRCLPAGGPDSPRRPTSGRAKGEVQRNRRPRASTASAPRSLSLQS